MPMPTLTFIERIENPLVRANTHELRALGGSGGGGLIPPITSLNGCGVPTVGGDTQRHFFERVRGWQVLVGSGGIRLVMCGR